MITPSERVQQLMQKGALPPEQGQTLLAAMGAKPPRWSLLLDPFARFSAERLVAVGLAVALLGALLLPFGITFDGFLDLHFTHNSPSWQLALVEAIVSWPLGALVFWVLSLVAARQGRFIDFLGVVGVARIPVVCCAALLAVVAQLSPRPYLTPDQPPALSVGLVATVVLALVGLGWFFVLLYRGFGTASGLRGPRRVVAFMAGVLLAEVGSKFALAALSRVVLST